MQVTPPSWQFCLTPEDKKTIANKDLRPRVKGSCACWMRVSVRVKTCGVHSADFITRTSGSNHGLDLSPCYVPHFKTFSFVINMITLKSFHAARSGIEPGFCLKGISCALKVSYFTGAGRLSLRIKLNQTWRDLSPLKLSYIMSNNGGKKGPERPSLTR